MMLPAPLASTVPVGGSVRLVAASRLSPEELIASIAEKALEGDTAAQRMLLDRIWPKPKGLAQELDTEVLPEELREPGALVAFGGEILRQVAAGSMAPAEAVDYLRGVAMQRGLIETEELRHRLEALEEKERGKR